MRNRIFIFILCLNAFVNSTYADCSSNLLTNGSFTGMPGVNVAAQGWTSSLTPDLNDTSGMLHTTLGYTWVSTPIASPDGGTWQNLIGPEALSQIVTLVPGHLYQICLEYTTQQIQSTSNLVINPAGAFILLNGVVVLTAPPDSSANTWESSCTTFTATTVNDTIMIRCTLGAYLAVDGICLIDLESTTEISPVGNASIKTYVNDLNSFNIINSDNTKYKIQVFDASANCIINRTEIGDYAFDISGLAKGIYFYHINNNKSVLNGRFVIN
jgi:hypothetical protein